MSPNRYVLKLNTYCLRAGVHVKRTKAKGLTNTNIFILACRANGKEYKVGESFQVDCNGCTCQPDGNAVCTLIACPVYCHYGGKKYAEGETFPAKDGCNTCSCKSDRSVECSRNPCYPSTPFKIIGN